MLDSYNFASLNGKYLKVNLSMEHIKWKPISLWKLWKLQFRPYDLDSRRRSREGAFANHPSHLP